MKALRENDTFSLPRAIDATVIGERESTVLAAGTIVTVVLVLGDESQPAAYEVEAYLPETDRYAIATVSADDVSS